MNTKPILYDLGIAGIAVTLWLTPADLTRALGYTISLLFSSRAYYTGICLLSKERKEDEKEGITYEAEVEFYDQLLGTNIEAALEIKALEVENKMLERMLPLMAQKTQLERQLQAVRPLSEEDIRKKFPEELDSASWKAILKALQSGAGKEQIVQEVLGCSGQAMPLGLAYLDYLKERFL